MLSGAGVEGLGVETEDLEFELEFSIFAARACFVCSENLGVGLAEFFFNWKLYENRGFYELKSVAAHKKKKKKNRHFLTPFANIEFCAL